MSVEIVRLVVYKFAQPLDLVGHVLGSLNEPEDAAYWHIPAASLGQIAAHEPHFLNVDVDHLAAVVDHLHHSQYRRILSRNAHHC